MTGCCRISNGSVDSCEHHFAEGVLTLAMFSNVTCCTSNMHSATCCRARMVTLSLSTW